MLHDHVPQKLQQDLYRMPSALVAATKSSKCGSRRSMGSNWSTPTNEGTVSAVEGVLQQRLLPSGG